MAKQISELTNKATPVATDELAIQETGGSTTKKATAGAILGAGIDGTFGDLTANNFLKVAVGAELTIASGVITVTSSYHTVDTEADASTDDLDTINGVADGVFLYLAAANSARTVVLKDGTGNLSLAGDFSMDDANDRILLIGGASSWFEVARSDNA